MKNKNVISILILSFFAFIGGGSFSEGELKFYGILIVVAIIVCIIVSVIQDNKDQKEKQERTKKKKRQNVEIRTSTIKIYITYQ